MITFPPSMSPAQRTYAVARAMFEATQPEARRVTAEFDAYCDRETAGMTDAQIADWFDRQPAEPHPALVAADLARRALHVAENAMLDWSAAVVGRIATPEQRAMIAKVNATLNVSYRARAVDLAFHLDGRSVPVAA